MSTGPETTGSTTSHRSGSRIALTLALALLALLGVDWLRTNWRESRQVTGDARWIWADVPTRFSPPRAFYAARDFDLQVVPETASLSVLGDEEYVLYLNGAVVGSNRFTSGAALDRYDLSSLLRPGRNRLVAHLRSGTGNGAFLAALWADDPAEPIVVSDESWYVARQRIPRLMEPDAEIPWRDQVVVVAGPPEGRWGRTTRGVERPRLSEIVAGRQEIPARRIMLPGRDWSRPSWRKIRRWKALGEWVVFDFGRRRTGYLMLDFPAHEPGVAVVYLGLDVPEPAARPPEVTVITVAGDTRWVDTAPRTFRYALVVGLDQVRDASVRLSDPELLAPIVAGEPVPGVFGLQAPRLRTPAENVVWSELEGFPSDAQR